MLQIVLQRLTQNGETHSVFYESMLFQNECAKLYRVWYVLYVPGYLANGSK